MGPAMGAGTPVCWDKRSVAWPTKCCRTWASEPSYSVAMRCCWCCVAAHPTRAHGPFLAARYGGARRCRQPRGVKCWKRPASAAADVFERDEKGNCFRHYVVIDLEAEYLAGDPRRGDDALDARWVTAAELRQLPVNATARRLLRERYGMG